MASVSTYLRQNVLGLVAIFLALSGGAYAVTNKQVFNEDLANSSVDSRVLAEGAVAGPDIQAAAVGPHKMKLDQLVKFLQTRVNGACPDTQLVQSITPDGGVVCAPAGAGTITGVNPSGGLTGGGDQGNIDLGINPSVIQTRISGTCTGNNAVQSVANDGTVACQPTGTGSVNSVGSGFGLSGGPITNTGTLDADPTVLQRRLNGSCTTNNAVQSIAQDGTPGCGSFVTGVTAGTGLSGGTISNSGTLSVDPAATQSRVTGTCSGNQALQSVAQNGGVGCQAITANGAAGGVLTGTYPNPGLGTGVVGTANIAQLPGGKIREVAPCQTVNNGSFDPVRFDELQFGSGVTYNPLIHGLVLGTAGRYLVDAEVIWPDNASGVRTMQIFQAGAEVGFDASVPVSGVTSISAATVLIQANAGDTLTATAGQASGGNLTLEGAFGGRCASLSAQWIGP